jgi:hypothetical protein
MHKEPGHYVTDDEEEDMYGIKAKQLPVWLLELLCLSLMPIYIWGLGIGLLVYSGLSSLLHIVIMLKKISRQLEER